MNSHTGTYEPVPPTPLLRRLNAAVPWWALTAVAVAVLVTVLVFVPSWQFDAWQDACLAAGALTGFALVAPVHRAAWRPSVLHAVASLGIVAGWAWAAYAVTHDGGDPVVLTAVVPAALAGLGHAATCIDDTAQGPRTYPWTVAAIVLAGGSVGWIREGLGFGLDAAVTVLIAAMPSALMVAPSLALITARRHGLRLGVRDGDAASIADIAQAKVAVLAKDGTITTGDLVVASVDPYDPDHERNMRWFAGALEHASAHPIGQAVAHLSGRGRLSNVEEHAGRGISGSVDRHPVRVGDPHWVGVEAPVSVWTSVAVEVDGRPLGTMTIADELRPQVGTDVKRLRDLGLDVVLLSTDRADRTEMLAAAAGITDVRYLDPGADAHTEIADLDRAVIADLRGSTPSLTTAGGDRLELDDLAVGRVAAALGWARTTSARLRRVDRLSFAAAAASMLLAATGLFDPMLALAAAAAGTAVAAVLAATAGDHS